MITRLLAAALLLASLAPVALRADDAGVKVEQPWARATPAGAKTAAIYLKLTDHGTPDHLIGVSTPAADMAMMHESYTEGGVSKMRMLDSVALDPDKPVTFQPGAMHIMLEGLKTPLRVGASFPLTLTFEKAPPQTVRVEVLKISASGPAAAMQDMPGMKQDMPGMKMGQ
jgi:periplasmic copper chaperone A